MAIEEQHRRILKLALQAEEARAKINMTTQARDFFIDRAIRHVYANYNAEANRDIEVRIAADKAAVLIKLVDSQARNFLQEGTRGRQFTVRGMQDFVANSKDCFYPFCRPTP